MVKTKLHAYILVIVLLLMYSNSNGQIASWNYEPISGSATNPTANTGTGTSSIVGTQTTPLNLQGMDPTNLAGCGSANGATAGSWHFGNFEPGTATETNGVQYNASTVGFSSISFTWDQRMSNTAPNTVRLQYNSGSGWTNFTMTTANTTVCSTASIVGGCFKTDTGDVYRRVTVNLSAITALNNNASFGIRLLAAFDPAAGQFRQSTNQTLAATNTGTWRFDNVKIIGVPGVGPTNTVINPSTTVGICAGSNATLRFVVTGGTAPFTIVYRDNFSNNFTVNSYVSGTSFNVSPTVNTTYTLVSIVDANGLTGVVSTTPTKTVTINAAPSLPLVGSTYNVSDFTACTGAVALPTTPSVAANFPPASFAVSGTSYSAVYTNTSTSSTFTFPLAAGAASMPFIVTIRNLTTNCVWTSPTYNFTRYVSPSISVHPSTTVRSNCTGTPFGALTVTGAGSGLSYQWYSDDGLGLPGSIVALTSAAEILRGSQSVSYTPQSTVLGTLKYYVRITGYCSPAVNSNYSGNHTVTPAVVAGSVAGAQTICAGTTPADLVLSGQTGSVIKWQKANDPGFSSGVTDISSTATTLSGATIGNLNQTTYFIAYVQNGTCTLTTAPVQVLIRTTTYTTASGWDNGTPDINTTVVFADNFTSSGNIDACAVRVDSGNIVIDSDDTLTIVNGLTIVGGTVTFENNASLVQVNNTTNIGNITYKRNTSIRRYDYTYWSSPVTSITLANLSPLTLSDKYIRFDGNSYTWSSLNAALTTMTAGLGYSIRGPQFYPDLVTSWPVTPTAWTGVFNGEPNNGDYTVQLYKNSATNDLNMIGNPYPSAISASALMDLNPGVLGAVGIGTTIYIWTHNTALNTANTYTNDDYASINRTGGTVANSGGNDPTDYIAAGQGFMISAVTPGPITFTNAMRRSGVNDLFFRNAATTEKSRLWLDFTNDQGAFKQLLVGYVDHATNNYEDGFDGRALESGNPIGFYSLVEDKKLSIQGRGLPFDANDQVPLGYKSNNSNTYTIKLSKFEGLFDNQNIFLEDKQLNIIHNLSQNPYSFTTEAGTFDTRFVLRFTESDLLGIGEPVFDKNSILVYKNPSKNIVVNSQKTALKNVQLFDALGRLIDEKNDINTTEVKFKETNNNGVLIVRIKLIDNQIISKKILN